MLGHRLHNLRPVVAGHAEHHPGALGQRQRGVGDYQRRVDFLGESQPQTGRAGAIGGVEAEVPRLQVVHRMTVYRTGQGQREALLAAWQAGCVIGQQLDYQVALGQTGGSLHRLGQAAGSLGFQHYTVDYHLDVMLVLLVQIYRFGQRIDLAVHPHPGKALLVQVGEQLAVLALAPPDYRRHDMRPLAIGRSQNAVHHLVGGLADNLPTAVRAVRDANAREQQAQVVIDLGDCANRGAGVLGCRLLVDGHRRRQPVDMVHVRLVHLPKELPGIGRKRLHIAPLPLGIDGVKGQRAFAAAGQPGNHHQLVPRNSNTDVLEVVFAGTANDDRVLH